MSIETFCPQCGRSHTVPDHFAGAKLRCPDCHLPLWVGPAKPDPPAELPDPEPDPPAAPGRITICCPACGAHFKALGRLAGERVRCPNCNCQTRALAGPPEAAAELPDAEPDPPQNPWLDVECPRCGEELQIRRRSVGKRQRCPRCDRLFIFDGEESVPARPPQPGPGTGQRPRSSLSAVQGLGIALAGLGGFCLLGALGMDTTVHTGYGGRVHNVGLMNDRLVGVVIGAALLIAGVLMLTLGGRRDR